MHRFNLSHRVIQGLLDERGPLLVMKLSDFGVSNSDQSIPEASDDTSPYNSNRAAQLYAPTWVHERGVSDVTSLVEVV